MEEIFFELRGEMDTEWVFADGSYVRAHQHASGARHKEERVPGKSFCQIKTFQGYCNTL